jgi:hypothetical protein
LISRLPCISPDPYNFQKLFWTSDDDVRGRGAARAGGGAAGYSTCTRPQFTGVSDVN